MKIIIFIPYKFTKFFIFTNLIFSQFWLNPIILFSQHFYFHKIYIFTVIWKSLFCENNKMYICILILLFSQLFLFSQKILFIFIFTRFFYFFWIWQIFFIKYYGHFWNVNIIIYISKIILINKTLLYNNVLFIRSFLKDIKKITSH